MPCPLYHSDATGFDITGSWDLPGNRYHSCCASLGKIGGRASGSALPGRAWERVESFATANSGFIMTVLKTALLMNYWKVAFLKIALFWRFIRRKYGNILDLRSPKISAPTWRKQKMAKTNDALKILAKMTSEDPEMEQIIKKSYFNITQRPIKYSLVSTSQKLRPKSIAFPP